jgi:6-phosphogluconolactonase
MTAGLRVYVGCSTGESRVGIHVFDLERTERGPTLVPRARVEDVAHPTFLTAHPTEPVLYAVSETVAGALVSFHIDPADGPSSSGNACRAPATVPCHLSDRRRAHLRRQLPSGSAAAYTLLPDGRISDLVWSARHRGSRSTRPSGGPHIHCAIH